MAKLKNCHQCKNYSELVDRLEKMLFTDQNSISNQLVFSTKHLRISKLIEWCSNQDISCFRNPDLKIFSQLGFISTHSIYVRGLAFGEQENEISLNQAINLLFTNRHLINRRNYVCVDDIPYETELRDRLQYPLGISYQKPLPADKSKRRHERFDILSNTACDSRREADSLRGNFFDCLESELKKCTNTNKFANFCVAHRQLETIRKHHEDKQNQKIQLQIEDLEKDYAALWKVFNTLSHYFFDTGYDPILHGTHQLAFIDEPVVKHEKLDEYKSLRDKLEREDSAKYKAFVDFENSQ